MTVGLNLKQSIFKRLIRSIDPVSSAVVHPMGSVVATCSGQKQFPDFSKSDDGVDSDGCREDSTSARVDNTLKVWAL